MKKVKPTWKVPSKTIIEFSPRCQELPQLYYAIRVKEAIESVLDKLDTQLKNRPAWDETRALTKSIRQAVKYSVQNGPRLPLK